MSNVIIDLRNKEKSCWIPVCYRTGVSEKEARLNGLVVAPVIGISQDVSIAYVYFFSYT